MSKSIREVSLTKGEGRIRASKRHADGSEAVSTHLRIDKNEIFAEDHGSAILTGRAYICEEGRYGSQSFFIFDPKTNGHVRVQANVFIREDGTLDVGVGVDADMEFTLKKDGEVVS
jgi:hypothetical protein